MSIPESPLGNREYKTGLECLIAHLESDDNVSKLQAPERLEMCVSERNTSVKV